MTELPIFETERLCLREAVESDLQDLWSIWNDPGVRRFLFDDTQVEREQASEVLASCRALTSQGLGMWVVEPKGERLTVGCVAILPTTVAAEFDPALRGLVEPLAAFNPSVWGRGYAREALRAIISYALRDLRLPMLAGVTDVPNEASDRMLRALGFTVQKECDGPKHRLRIYSLLPEAFVDGRR
jgi:ribosomal-protein-alanine N-acetyltransferase